MRRMFLSRPHRVNMISLLEGIGCFRGAVRVCSWGETGPVPIQCRRTGKWGEGLEPLSDATLTLPGGLFKEGDPMSGIYRRKFGAEKEDQRRNVRPDQEGDDGPHCPVNDGVMGVITSIPDEDSLDDLEANGGQQCPAPYITPPHASVRDNFVKEQKGEKCQHNSDQAEKRFLHKGPVEKTDASDGYICAIVKMHDTGHTDGDEQ